MRCAHPFLVMALVLLVLPPAAAAAQTCTDWTATRQPFFGDVHVHTALSFDAYTFETRNGPRDAYRFAKGEAVGLPPLDAAGEPTRSHALRVPLDFAAVTDHAEMLGETRLCTAGNLEIPACQAIRDGNFALVGFYFGAQFTDADPQRRAFCGTDGQLCLQAAASPWTEVQQAAAEHDDASPACSFSTFVGYEWTASPGGDMGHRNVLFRGADVPSLPQSYVEIQDPFALWNALDAQCASVGGDCEAITIPHNSNLSAGITFETTGPGGSPLGFADALYRRANEPLVELTQHKGDSECRPGVGTATDPSCAYEKLASGPPGLDAPLAYVRNALLEGLAIGTEIGANPFAQGFIGSSDTHNGTPGSTLEDDFPGHTGKDDATAAQRLAPSRVGFNPGGLMAVYAEENERASLFAGIGRRETYATTGTRPTLRFFGGFDLPAGLCSAPDLAAQGYATGVPMGGELAAEAGDDGPRFVVAAMQDPGSPGFPGTPLAQIEIVKGWVDSAGARHESVVSVAGGPPGPDALDVATCTPDGSGAATLCGEWQDFDFDPDEHAFYYARLLESPTCRWSARECRAQGVDCGAPPPAGFESCCDGSFSDAIQERATSSPIWVRPVPEPSIGSGLVAGLLALGGLGAPRRARRGRLAASIAAALAALMAACSDGEAPPSGEGAAGSAPPPNVVLIVVDTLRADHLSHYGYARATGAPLDAFRARSTLFTRAWSTAPWTGPSTMSILTGLSPLQHRATEHGDVLPDEATTLAEHLSAAGYSTHGISFNFEVKGQTGFAQGFDRFDDFLGKVVDYPDIRQMVRRTEQWLATDPPEPFFLYLHPMNVHGPYRVPKSRQTALLGRAPSPAFEYWDRALMTPLMRKGKVELREQVTPEIVESAVDQYDVAIRYSMEEIARILAALEQAGRMENTLVVLTADHGEELFEHGGFSHGFTLHREIVHVPLYLHLPGQTEPATDDRIVSQLDLVPTILARAGRPKPAELTGIDLLADGGAEARPLVQHAGWAERATGLSLVQGADHLVDLEKSYDAPGPRLSLYDLERDPGETRDRAVDEAAEAERLRGVLRAEADRLAETGRLPDPENILHELDEEDTARLRALGYVE